MVPESTPLRSCGNCLSPGMDWHKSAASRDWPGSCALATLALACCAYRVSQMKLTHMYTVVHVYMLREQMGNMPSWFVAALTAALNAAYSQPPSLGAQPQLYAALHPTATVNASDGLRGGELVGPRFVLFGSPVLETTDFCQLSPRCVNAGAWCQQVSARRPPRLSCLKSDPAFRCCSGVQQSCLGCV